MSSDPLDARTQELIAQRIGMAVIASARFQAENEDLRKALAAAKASGTPDGARGADEPGTKDDRNG